MIKERLSFKLKDFLNSWILIFYTLIFYSDLSEGIVNITQLIVPRLIENATQTSIVLDCVYTLDEYEDRNLVVKWFFNDDPEAIYQWIPELNSRHASRRWEKHINLDYSTNTNNPLTRYRAVNLIRPTTEHSGTYSCHVMSWRSQDSEEKVMTVYAPPRIFEFNYTRRRPETPAALRNNFRNNHLEPDYSSPGAILTCDIKKVFPVPSVIIYRIRSDGTNPSELPIYSSNVEEISLNVYNVQVSSIVSDLDIVNKYGDQPSIFECLVTAQLPNKDFSLKKRITYFPDANLYQANKQINGQTRNPVINLTLSLLLVIIFIIV